MSSSALWKLPGMRLAGHLAWHTRDRLRRVSLRRLRDRINKLDVVQFGLRGLLLRSMVHHVSGPRHSPSMPGEVVVISVMRNGMPWLRSFLGHHRALGISHFVIMDNGSDDGTVEFLSTEPDVTLLVSDAPYHAYENTMKRHLAEHYCAGRWCLCVDVDELFEYPFMDRVPLSGFIEYLDGRGYTAVVTQMLDMFSDTPLNRLRSKPDDDFRQVYCWYDIYGVRKSDYDRGIADEHIVFHSGGIRWLVFGTDNGLTKVSLFKMVGTVRPFIHWHHVNGGKIADVSCVLLHYPFVSEFYDKVADAIATGRYGHLTNDEYRLYGAGLGKEGDLHLRRETSKRYTTPEALLEDDFLYASPEYLRVFAGEGEKGK